jgi:hypothetical protein
MTGRVRSMTAAVWRVDWGLPPAYPATRGTDASGQAPEGQRTRRVRSNMVARPVMIDRTRQVVSGNLLESTRRWHYGVRSSSQQREHLATGLHGVSGQFDRRVRSCYD